ncbi:Appr-1-p processing enzyme family protein [Histomonas meleagridis]|uniref:Appr-1-p processing enzyme family protein n=1 Tax=Histomonas meleagridis TaxID=135588 RepID=UPI003559DA49|nr:Appr-1-p processing enzyme family protein [Histomonas meleagridis]KAH0798813.1 Appr-1-p processing enzyme family protein [Histomonas meleagridis]
MSQMEQEEKESFIKLAQIPTWKDYGPRVTPLIRKPSPESVIFQPNSEINSLISFLPNGDSTELEVDAIVNAANSDLLPGGGICGAIHSAAGKELAHECKKIGHTPTGKAALTPGFKLPSKYVIHAVGPVGEHPDKLEEVYKSTLAFIDGDKIRSVALCCISTGIYGYPIQPATKIALRVVREYLEIPENRPKVDRIIFVVFLRRDVAVYCRLLPLYFPLEGDVKYYEEEEIEEEEENQSNDFLSSDEEKEEQNEQKDENENENDKCTEEENREEEVEQNEDAEKKELEAKPDQ